MSKGKRPESKVGGGVGDAAQTKLDGVDCLVDEHFSKLKLGGEKKALMHFRKKKTRLIYIEHYYKSHIQFIHEKHSTLLQ